MKYNITCRELGITNKPATLNDIKEFVGDDCECRSSGNTLHLSNDGEFNVIVKPMFAITDSSMERVTRVFNGEPYRKPFSLLESWNEDPESEFQAMKRIRA